MSGSRPGRNAVALVGAALAGGATFAVTALAQQAGDAPAVPVLHEDLTPPADEATRTAQELKTRQNVFGPPPSEGQNPSAIGANAKILPAPNLAASPSAEEPVHGAGGFAADRVTDFSPDRNTAADGTLHYVEVFNPSVVPFKRMTALDSVDATYNLHSHQRELADMPVGGEPASSDELFWGSLVIQLTTGQDVPIPSVSPDMRILSYEASPRVPLVFSRDGADNFFVRSDEPGLAGQDYRLVFLVAADSHYFSPEIPRGVLVREIDSDLIRPMPPTVRAVAERALKKLRVNRNMEVEEALQKLVYYFRSFEAKTPPTSTGDIYWDLFESQAGVCRHRAFAFMITANALGIPARFVSNEAHAWAEVYLPGSRWTRVDLGGAAARLEVSNAADKTLHRPRGEDPFHQPPQYSDNYTQLSGEIGGLSSDQIAEARSGGGDSRGRGAEAGKAAAGEGEGEGEADGEGGFFDSEEAEGPAAAAMTGPGKGLPEIPARELEGKTPTRIVVGTAASTAFRGETMAVSGVVSDDGQRGVAGQRVDIFLAPRGSDGDSAVVVGHTITGDDGQWSAVIQLPRELELREYELYASTPGDDKYQPTLSE